MARYDAGKGKQKRSLESFISLSEIWKTEEDITASARILHLLIRLCGSAGTTVFYETESGNFYDDHDDNICYREIV